MGDPPRLLLAGQSTAFPITVRPVMEPLAADAVKDVVVDGPTGLRSGRVTVKLKPPVGARQQVTLMLNAAPGEPVRSFVFPAERRTADAAEMKLPFSRTPAGTYLIRVSVDGAETSLVADPATGRYAGPVVTVP
jgi:hypothetical protein